MPKLTLVEDDKMPIPGELAVSIVIPAFNEENGVGPQVEAVSQVMNAYNITHEIIVVDDGSQDLTADKAFQAGARVLRHLYNRGYGASLKTGIMAAKYDAIAITDADGTYPSEQIPAMLAKLETADMVVGARTGENVNIPLIRKPGKLILGWLANQVGGQKIPDLNSGLRLFWRDCAIQYFPVLSNKFSFTSTITLAFMADDYKVEYHPINYFKRIGKSKITPRHFFDFIILVIRMAMLFQPLKVFVPMVAVFLTLGSLKVVLDIVTALFRTNWSIIELFSTPVLSTSALLLLLVGFQLLLIGMMADGVIRRIARHNQTRAVSHGVHTAEVTGVQQISSTTAKVM